MSDIEFYVSGIFRDRLEKVTVCNSGEEAETAINRALPPNNLTQPDCIEPPLKVNTCVLLDGYNVYEQVLRWQEAENFLASSYCLK